MKRLFVSTLALCLAATTGLASAQTYSAAPYNAQAANVRYDYARVLRVDPVFDSGNGSGYATSNSQRCYQRNTVVHGDDSYNGGYNNGGYNNGGYNNGGYYPNRNDQNYPNRNQNNDWWRRIPWPN